MIHKTIKGAVAFKEEGTKITNTHTETPLEPGVWSFLT